MTNHELWKMYENILSERARLKAERRARRLADAEMAATADRPPVQSGRLVGATLEVA
jgi:hypothetical protein